MSNPEVPHFENDVLIVSPDQTRAATMLTEEILADFIDDRFDWPAEGSSEGINAVQRTMTDEGHIALIATKARVCVLGDSRRLQLTRYLLELETRGFMVIPELQDLSNPLASEDSEDINETLFELGFNQADIQDWSDFIDILYEGKEFLQTLRSIEQKLGIQLGKAATSHNWDQTPSQS